MGEKEPTLWAALGRGPMPRAGWVGLGLHAPNATLTSNTTSLLTTRHDGATAAQRTAARRPNLAQRLLLQGKYSWDAAVLIVCRLAAAFTLQRPSRLAVLQP